MNPHNPFSPGFIADLLAVAQNPEQMSYQKEYSQQNKPSHPLVKAAIKKGLTNFKITWHKAMSRTGRGWAIESDQVKWQRIGHDQESALKAINDLQIN